MLLTVIVDAIVGKEEGRKLGALIVVIFVGLLIGVFVPSVDGLMTVGLSASGD